MKALIILIVFSCYVLYAFGQISEQRKHFILMGQKFTVIVQDTLEDVQHKTLHIFNQNESKLLLASPLNHISADCYQYAVMVGDYEFTDSTLVLYHFWAKAGDAPLSPYGARIQIYELMNDSLILKESELYIETMSDYYIKQHKDQNSLGYHVGCLYLHQTPTKETEKQYLNTYISEVEKEYKGKFLFGTQANLLLNRVRERLNAILQPYTGDWEMRYKHDRFGYLCRLNGSKLHPLSTLK